MNGLKSFCTNNGSSQRHNLALTVLFVPFRSTAVCPSGGGDRARVSAVRADTPTIAHARPFEAYPRCLLGAICQFVGGEMGGDMVMFFRPAN